MLEGPVHEIVDAVVGVSGGNGFEGGFELGVGFDPVQLHRLDERGDVSPSGGTFVVARERRDFTTRTEDLGITYFVLIPASREVRTLFVEHVMPEFVSRV